jgi:hypothetical protein
MLAIVQEPNHCEKCAVGKKPRMRRAILLLMAGVMLSCLGIFLTLPQTTASEVPEVPAAPAGEDGGSNAPPPEESYALRAVGERQKKDELPVNASLLTMLVLAIASFGGGVLWLLATNACRQGAICSWRFEGGDRRWLAAAREGPSSFLGVFRL